MASHQGTIFNRSISMLYDFALTGFSFFEPCSGAFSKITPRRKSKTDEAFPKRMTLLELHDNMVTITYEQRTTPGVKVPVLTVDLGSIVQISQVERQLRNIS